MSSKFKHIGIYLLVIVIFSFNILITVATDDSTTLEPIVILFDEGHGQFFNRSLYSQAISDLTRENKLVLFSEGELNSTSFEGIDIFVSTNPQESYSNTEIQRIATFLYQGNSMLLLANPLDEDNVTMNGRCDILNVILNTFLSDPEYNIRVAGEFYTNIENIRHADIVRDEFSNVTGSSNYLYLEVNSSDHEILTRSKNVTSLVTYSCSLESSKEKIITGSHQAYAETILGEIHAFSSDIILFGTTGELDNGARIVMGGSSIMFSDLEGPFTGTSWYESENNSILWQNTFDWLTEAKTSPTTPVVSSDQIFLLVLSITMVALVLLIGGNLTFFIGSGRKIMITKSEELPVPIPQPSPSGEKISEPSPGKPTPSIKESKRDRRLRQ
ncbi:MAG: hypothetical protein JSV04_05810, partial [Candidatus Heimdallarchaeota archaeon]